MRRQPKSATARRHLGADESRSLVQQCFAANGRLVERAKHNDRLPIARHARDALQRLGRHQRHKLKLAAQAFGSFLWPQE